MKTANCLISMGCLLMLSPGLVRAETVPSPKAPTGLVFWTTADGLMPAWGFYPNGQAYGDTKPLGRSAAWTAAGTQSRLTWVADFPADTTWHVWVRRYGGYGTMAVALDEREVGGGRGHPGGGRYVWEHLGSATVAKGSHHVDVLVGRGMLDAVLFATDATWSPASGPLPTPVKAPVLRALRAYRDDSALRETAGSRGYVVGQVEPDEEILYDWVPSPRQTTERIRLWGAANQYIVGTFAVRVLETVEELRATLRELVGPGQAKIGPERIAVT